MGSGETSGYRAEVWREPAGQRPRPSLRTLQAAELFDDVESQPTGVLPTLGGQAPGHA
jgi:hypothetical protein